MKVLIGLSGGINSMAVLCWLAEQPVKPTEVHLFYAHFLEHSPDTFQFVADGIRFAKKNFERVVVKITKNSVLDFFEKQKMIPHPMVSPCTKHLKIIPINKYAAENDIKIDLVGYVKHELGRRGRKQQGEVQKGLFDLEKQYPIGDFDDEWCFNIVDKYIGWHPRIYDLVWSTQDFLEGLCEQREIGKKIFKHNNCLPCKNWTIKLLMALKKYFPAYFKAAIILTHKLNKYWGRSEADFYTRFGNDLGQDTSCETCKF